MAQCNFCSLKAYRKKAKQEGKRIILKPSNFMGGTDVFAVPRGEKLPENRIDACEEYPNGNENFRKYHKAWFMAIGNHCEC